MINEKSKIKLGPIFILLFISLAYFIGMNKYDLDESIKIIIHFFYILIVCLYIFLRHKKSTANHRGLFLKKEFFIALLLINSFLLLSYTKFTGIFNILKADEAVTIFFIFIFSNYILSFKEVVLYRLVMFSLILTGSAYLHELNRIAIIYAAFLYLIIIYIAFIKLRSVMKLKFEY